MKKPSLAMTLSILTILILLSFIIISIPELIELQHKITGLAISALMDTFVIIPRYNESLCNLTLAEDWNLISTPCIPDLDSPGYVFGNINGSFYSIHTYLVDSTDHWKAYNPTLPGWVVQDLTLIERERGYWINMKNATNFTLPGKLQTPNLIYLKSGWNLIGYPTLTSKPINESLQDIYPNYQWVYAYNASDINDTWKEYTWNTSLSSDQDLNYTVPYLGYWILMTQDDMWIITW